MESVSYKMAKYIFIPVDKKYRFFPMTVSTGNIITTFTQHQH